MDNDPMAAFRPPTINRYTPRDADLVNCDGAAELLGVSRRTFERALAARGSRIPRPFRLGPGLKRVWLRADIIAYRSALAFLSQPR